MGLKLYKGKPMYKCQFCHKVYYNIDSVNIQKTKYDDGYAYICKSGAVCESNRHDQKTNYYAVSAPKFKINDFIKVKGFKLYGFIIEVQNNIEDVRASMMHTYVHTTSNVPYQRRIRNPNFLHSLTPFYKVYLNLSSDAKRWEVMHYNEYMKTADGYINENVLCLVKKIK